MNDFLFIFYDFFRKPSNLNHTFDSANNSLICVSRDDLGPSTKSSRNAKIGILNTTFKSASSDSWINSDRHTVKLQTLYWCYISKSVLTTKTS